MGGGGFSVIAKPGPVISHMEIFFHINDNVQTNFQAYYFVFKVKKNLNNFSYFFFPSVTILIPFLFTLFLKTEDKFTRNKGTQERKIHIDIFKTPLTHCTQNTLFENKNFTMV